MIREKLEKISCVMVTLGRLDYLKQSVCCYINQTYKNKELVIVSQAVDCVNQDIKDFICSLHREDIIFIEASQQLCLGAMRNLSIEASTGEIICQWDDDDIYHPERLIAQYRFISHGAIASFYSAFLKYFVDKKTIYCCDWSEEKYLSHRFLCGTAMFLRSVYYDYDSLLYPEHGPQSHVEEDLNVLEKLLSIGEIGSPPFPYHYVYIYHGQNTYDLDHHNATICSGKKRLFGKKELLNYKPHIEQTLRSVRLKDEIQVRSADDLVFIYLWSGVD